MTTDPWHKNNIPSHANSIKLEFEDNFITSDNLEIGCTNTLPDSKHYLASLEKKLKKLKSDPKILEQLAQKREECLSSLINNDSINLDSNVEFDETIGGDSAVHDIYRHLYPIQPINVGETIHIVKYDQLQQQEEESTATTDSEQILENSSETASR